jgi:RNA polymerase sigma factor (sigma-70 family)
LNEKELIEQLQQGSEPAFKLLVDNYRMRVHHTILTIVRNEEEAEDATQETFIQVYESVNSFRSGSSLATWIYRIAVHKAIDKLRRRKIRRRLQQWLPWWLPNEHKSEERPFYHPGIELDKKETAAILFKAVAALPERQQLAFTVIKIQGMSYAEACDILELPVKTIESLVSRASKNLQVQLQHWYKENKD